MIVPLDRWSKITEKGMRFALALSHDVRAVHIDCGEHNEALEALWQRNVVAPVQAAGLPVPELVTLQSPYRVIIVPLVEYVLKMEQEHAGPHHRGAGAGVGGEALVGKPDAQPASPAAQADAAGQGQSGHRGVQYSLVPAGIDRNFYGIKTVRSVPERPRHAAQGMMRVGLNINRRHRDEVRENRTQTMAIREFGSKIFRSPSGESRKVCSNDVHGFTHSVVNICSVITPQPSPTPFGLVPSPAPKPTFWK